MPQFGVKGLPHPIPNRDLMLTHQQQSQHDMIKRDLGLNDINKNTYNSGYSTNQTTQPDITSTYATNQPQEQIKQKSPTKLSKGIKSKKKSTKFDGSKKQDTGRSKK